MKRQQDMDMSPRNKRMRSSYSSHDDNGRSDYGADSRREHRDGPRDGRGKYNNIPMKDHRDYDPDRSGGRYKDDRMMNGPYGTRDPRSEFRSLVITGLSQPVPDHALRDALFKEFKKFGEFNVKVTHTPNDQRIAYVNFCYPEDARVAKSRRSEIVLFDKLCHVDPVIKSQYHQQERRRRSLSPDFNGIDHRDMDRDNYSHGSLSPGRGRSIRHDSLGRDIPPRDRGDRGDYRRGLSSSKDKFPYHLQHVNPEDDSAATRTLFVGNLDYNISENELRHIFGKFGSVQEVDIKRPGNPQGSSYAFVKFHNLDVAHKAKVAMSGKYIGKYICKIGYGKVTPTTCLWVGGLGPWIRLETLEREFDRFGVINKIEWPHGKNYSYVLYDSIDAAQAACQEMRGFSLGGSDKRLRVDFVDPSQMVMGSPQRTSDNVEFDHRREDFRGGRGGYNGSGDGGGYRNNRTDRDPDMYRNQNSRNYNNQSGRDFHEDRRKRTFDRPEERNFRSRTPTERSRDFSPPRGDQSRRHYHDNRNHSPSPNKRSIQNERQKRSTDRRTSDSDGRGSSEEMSEKPVRHVTTLGDLVKCLTSVWKGALVLKSSAFPARLFHIAGNPALADTIMKDNSTNTTMLRITQRLRLDQPKLEEVSRRLVTSGSSSYAIFLAMPTTNLAIEDPNIQQRPLKNLVTYLKQKEAAGVISLPPGTPKDKDDIGILHAFPPCEFGQGYLRGRAPDMPDEPATDDHLVIVVVRGAP